MWRKKTWRLCAVVVLVFMVLTFAVGRWLMPARYRLCVSWGDARYSILNELNDRLRAGMTHEEVEAVTGLPDNRDTEYVWVWGRSPFWRNSTKRSWRATDFRFYLVFDKGRLLSSTLIKAAEGDPVDAYMGFTGDYSEEARRKLDAQ